MVRVRCGVRIKVGTRFGVKSHVMKCRILNCRFL